MFNFTINFTFAISQALLVIFQPFPIVIPPNCHNVSQIRTSELINFKTFPFFGVQEIKNVNPNCARHVTDVNTTLANLAATTASLRTNLKSDKCSKDTATLGGNVIDSHEDGMQKIGHGFMSIATILAAQRPTSPPPFYCRTYDPPYQSYSSSCLPPAGSSAVATIGCQSKEFVNFVPFFTRDIYNFALDFETSRKEVSSIDCSMCPDTSTVQAVIMMWNNLSISVNASTGVTSTGSLMAYVNATLGGKFTQAMNETSKLMQNCSNCSACLVDRLQQNKVKNFRQCKNGVINKSSGSGEKTLSCQQKCQNTIKRSKATVQKHQHHCRKKAFTRQQAIFDQLNANIFATFSLFSQALANLSSSAAQIWNIFNYAIRTSLVNLQTTLISLNKTFNVIMNNITVYTTTTLNTTHSTLNATLYNATDFVTNLTSNFVQQVADDIDLYPCCQEFGNKSLAIQTNYSQDVVTCFADGDNITDSIALNVTLQLAFMGNAFNTFSNSCDSCIRQSCTSFTCLNGFVPVATISNCINSVNTAASGFAANAFALGNFTFNGVKTNCTNVIELVQNCTESKVRAAVVALQKVQAEYELCKQNQTCDAFTTTTTTTSTTTTSEKDF